MYNISYEIKPIFYPNENFYEDFVRLELLCDECKNHSELYKKEIKSFYKMAEDEKYRFVFAAFHNNEMIGFTHGFFAADEKYSIFLDALYVNPLYHCLGIGTNLLKTTENAVSIFKPNMHLFPLVDAIGFYQKCRYNYYRDGGVFIMKKLPKDINGVVPVFEWCDELNNKLNLKIDEDLMNDCKHQPKFVYIGKNNKIDGVAALLPDGERYIRLNEKQKSLSKCRKAELLAALDKCR